MLRRISNLSARHICNLALQVHKQLQVLIDFGNFFFATSVGRSL